MRTKWLSGVACLWFAAAHPLLHDAARACRWGRICAAHATAQSQEGGSLGEQRVRIAVSITDLENSVGSAGVALWHADEGFPEDIESALRTSYVPITDSVARVSFDGLEPGAYAVTVYNDLNNNRRFDKNWIGMPKEAWGVSNNVRPRLRAPRFEEAVFDSGAEGLTLEIRLE